MNKVLVYWEGLPSCAALLRKLSIDPEVELIVVATRPSVPFENLDAAIGASVQYIKLEDFNWRSEFSDWPDLFIFTGWCNRGILKYANWLKNRCCKTTCCVSDNNLRFSVRQILGSVYFRLFLSKKFSYLFVPGISAYYLMKFFGVDSSRIVIGNYGASSMFFDCTKSFAKRDKRILFVGSLDERKRVRQLVDGFEEYKRNGGVYELCLAGVGPYSGYKSFTDGIEYVGFIQPNELGDLMNNSRLFVLLSVVEHWGTVLAEAARCGCVLLTSSSVGASPDLIKNGINGYTIDRFDRKAIAEQFFKIEKVDINHLSLMSEKSVLAGKFFDEGSYYLAVKSMLKDNEG